MSGDAADRDSSATERAEGLIAQAHAFVHERRWRDALHCFDEAIRANPTNASAVHDLAVLLCNMGLHQEAENKSRLALSLAPRSAVIEHGLAHVLLGQGKFREGFVRYQARERLPELNGGFPRNFPFPRWDGEPLAGKRLAIFPEQGLGDQIQFARFLPRLIEQAGTITLLTRKPLERLFRYNFPEAEIVVADGVVEFPDPDYWTTSYDVMRVLGIELADVAAEPYLTAPGRWPAIGTGFLIGLKTSGNAKHVNDAARSLPQNMADRLRARLSGQIVELDPEQSGAADLADTAAIIQQLDVVVSVDTAVAHLAGALGKSCLLLIPGYAADWRWLSGRSDTPWYRRTRLYRGDVERGWAGAIDRLIADLKRVDTPGRRLMRESNVLRTEGRFAEALARGKKALAADPRNPFATHNMARLLTELGRLTEGEKLQRHAVALAPDLPDMRYGLGLNLLAQGRYAEAWPFYEARTQMPALNTGFPQRVRFPRWQGEYLAGKRIAVFPEQGLGDALQFARLLPELRSRGAEIVMLAARPLARLFRLAFPEVTVVIAAGTASFPRCDVWTTIVDLARYADLSIASLPAGDYLSPLFAQPVPGAALRIGIMTRGNPAYVHDVYRSLPSDAATRLRGDLPGLLTELDPDISGARDFLDTARIMAGLDLIVSVDTSVGHLAGAMAKPCLLLINAFATDWRWMQGGDTSVWYPDHRLFRSEIGSWDGAVGRMIARVRAMCEQPALP